MLNGPFASVDEIVKGLKIGSSEVVDFDLKPQANLSIMSEEGRVPKWATKYKFIMLKDIVNDANDEIVIEKIKEGVKFIEENIEQGVVVNCKMGASRSVAVVAAYLMKTLKISYLEAWMIVKQKRNIAHPNAQFARLLNSGLIL